MGNRSRTDMFDDNLHLGGIGETPILLFEAEMRRMQVHDERGRMFRILLQYVWGSFH